MYSRNQFGWKQEPNDRLYTSNKIANYNERKNNKADRHNHSEYSHDQDELLCLGWNRSGNLLAGGFANTIKIWVLSEANLKEAQKKSFTNFEMLSVKFLNEEIFGALSDESIRFWDLRESGNKEILCLNNPRKDWCLFDIHQEEFTIGSAHELLNYDFRAVRKRDTIVKTYLSEMEILDLRWSNKYSTLLCSSGNQNKGFLTILNKKLEKQACVDIHSSAIVKIEIDEESKRLIAMGEDNLITIHSIPELLYESKISVEEELFIENCQISQSGSYLAVIMAKEANIYNISKGYEQPIKKILIEKYSPVAWNPVIELMVYLEEKGENKMSEDRNKQKQTNPFGIYVPNKN